MSLYDNLTALVAGLLMALALYGLVFMALILGGE